MRYRRPQLEEQVQINLTPLIDVIFVMLVIFMVIAPLLHLDQVELASGSSETTEQLELDRAPIQIQVHSDHSLYINAQRVSLEQLPTVLAQLKQLYPEATPLLFYDKRAQFGLYQQIKTELERVGFAQMQLVLRPA